MGLESPVNFISDLNPLNPAEGDLAKDGDNHIRLIKGALKATFPNINGAVTPTQAELNKLAGLATTKVELGYLAGVTSAIQTQIDAILNSLIPVGTITEYAGSTNPSGNWLLCRGQAVARVGTYAALFAVIGTTYGAGDGSTTFNVPNFQGVSPRGLDVGRGFDTGRVLGSYQADGVLSHSHTASSASAGAHTHGVTDPGHSHSMAYGFGTGGNAGVGTVSAGAIVATGTIINGSGTGISIQSAGAHTHPITVDATGIAENRVKNIAVNYIIRF